MRTFTLIAVVLSAALCPLSTSHAADDKGERETRRVMHAYAKCVVRSKADRASSAILANLDNGEIMRRYGDLISPECLAQVAGNVSMRFGGDLYRYALADALVNREFAAAPARDFADRLPLAHLPLPSKTELDTELAATKSKRRRAELEESYSKDLAVGWLSRFGECIVRANPEKARRWLLTPADSAEETSRINDLRPDFSNCRGEGKLTFTRTTMRGTVAINYFRLAHATAVPAAGTN